MFNSPELQNATHTSSSITEVILSEIKTDSIKNLLKEFLIRKDSNLLKPYDLGHLSKSVSISANDTIKDILLCLREYYINKYIDDNIKNLTIRKIFDSMIISLECLMINGIDVNTEEFYALVIGFLNKNCL
jgi:hypothetical protein